MANSNPILEYHAKIQSREIVAGEKVKRVYQNLVDLLNNKDSEWVFSEKHADHILTFIEKYCKQSKGKMGGKPLFLELWQRAALAAAFGIIHKIDGTRKYQEVWLVVARKNGKSTLGAPVGLYLMIADNEPGAEVYCVGTKYDQAKIVWLEAKRMVKKSPVLAKRVKTLIAEISCDINDSLYKPLGADSNRQDGLNVHGAIYDEVHAWPDMEMYNVVKDGTSAREQPMIFVISTAGTIREGCYDTKYDEIELVLKDPAINERMLPIIYELDNRNEWTDEAKWLKANPGLGTIKSLDQLRQKVKTAQHMPLLQKNLLCKDFNIRETSAEAFLTFDQILNTKTFNVSDLAPKPKYAFGGVDLSSNVDLTAAVTLFKTSPDSPLYVMPMFWLPEDLLEKRSREDKIPYDIWHRMGLLRASPGNTVHPKLVTEWFVEIQNDYGIYFSAIGYDAWSAKYWVEEMGNYFGPTTMEPVQQGKKTLSSPMRSLGADLEKKLIIYNNNPILKWNMSNVIADIDKNNNIQPSKGAHQRKRIDGFAALLNAYVTYQNHLEMYLSLI